MKETIQVNLKLEVVRRAKTLKLIELFNSLMPVLTKSNSKRNQWSVTAIITENKQRERIKRKMKVNKYYVVEHRYW